MTAHLKSVLNVSVGQMSTAGHKPQNEDCLGMRVPEQPLLTMKGVTAVIADGVSAAEAGKEASETCVRNFISDYYATPDAWSVKRAGQKVLDALNRWLYSQTHSQSQRRGYVSTLSALILKSQKGYIFHVGDTRIYRLREDALECLTRDHATVINDETIYLSRAMGMDSRLEMDFREIDIKVGDAFLLSTDGIHDFVSTPDIIDTLSLTTVSAEARCKGLIDTALKNGSHDNLSCQIITIDSLPEANSQEVYDRLAKLRFPPPLEKGQLLDGYRVVKELHASQRSQLYLVEQTGRSPNEDTIYRVMKTPSLNYEDDPAYIERFILEQWIGRRIDSPYVVKVVEPIQKRTALYTLMEYLPGKTLADWIKENPRPDIQWVVELVEKISRGIRAFHRKEVLHQDLKPDNIIFDHQNNPVIIDFGACYIAGVEEIDAPFAREDALGTADYSAPETRFRSAKTVKSDLFSLAVITYEMLTGQKPFGDELEKLTDQRHCHRLKYRAIQHYNPMVPQWMDGAIRKALSILPDQRQQALSEFVYELQHPNRRYQSTQTQPLLERNPLIAWKTMAFVQWLLILFLLYLVLT